MADSKPAPKPAPKTPPPPKSDPMIGQLVVKGTKNKGQTKRG